MNRRAAHRTQSPTVFGASARSTSRIVASSVSFAFGSFILSVATAAATSSSKPSPAALESKYALAARNGATKISAYRSLAHFPQCANTCGKLPSTHDGGSQSGASRGPCDHGAVT